MSEGKIVVFGATGQVGGSALRELLRHADQEVVAVTRVPQKLAHSNTERLSVVCYDLDRPEREGLQDLIAILTGAERVFLATGYDVRMLPQSKAVIDAAVAAGVEHIVHLGAHVADDTTIVHLGWHRLIEAYLASAGPAWTNIRPTSFMQNLLLLRAISGAPRRVIVDYYGGAQSSWVDVQDVGRATATVLRDPQSYRGRTVRLGTQSASFSELAALLSGLSGEQWEVEKRDPDNFVSEAVRAGADPTYMECVGTIFRRLSVGGLPDLNETFDDYYELTGERPVALEQFLRQNLKAFEA